MSFKIVVDSCCDLTPQMMKEGCYIKVPLTIRSGGSVFIDDESFDQADLLASMKADANAPSTACPSPQAYLDAYESGEGDIYVVTLSALLSGSHNSAEQAKRDAVLAFRQEIGAELTKLLAQDTHKALDDKALAALITAALQGEDASAYAAEVASVTDALKSELAGELKAGLELRLSKKVHTGFRLCAKDGSGYIDCSDEELAEQLAPFFRELRI